jgi:thiol-disulfide isomerase/thioredoxin
MMSLVFALFFLGLVLHFKDILASVDEMSFPELEADTSMKLVLFHDPSVEASNAAMAVAKELSEMEEFAQYYLFKSCDVTAAENKGAADAGLTGGTVFTHTPEAGIDAFDGELTVESFRSFHDFRVNEVDGDNVKSMTDLEDVFALAESKPVFLKMFEQWCGHCKKMKKHFQYASTQENSSVHFVEVECSASGNFCAQFGVNSYPSVRLLAKVDDDYKIYNYEGARTHGALASFGANALSVADGNWEDYSGIVPDITQASEEL